MTKSKFLKGNLVEVFPNKDHSTSYRGIITNVKMHPRKGIRYRVVIGNAGNPSYYRDKPIELSVGEHELELVIPKNKTVELTLIQKVVLWFKNLYKKWVQKK